MEKQMKLHWFFENPWRQKAVFVPFDQFLRNTIGAMCWKTRLQRQYGEKFDAYILAQPDGSFQAGIRYGANPDQYLSPDSHHIASLVRLHREHELQWRPCRWDDELSRPTKPGTYQFRIAGDSETDGPHVYYDFPDYTTFGTVADVEDGEVHAQGSHDEEPDTIIAWYGPINLPDCDVFA
jgi:hypothetical protein